MNCSKIHFYSTIYNILKKQGIFNSFTRFFFRLIGFNLSFSLYPMKNLILDDYLFGNKKRWEVNIWVRGISIEY